MISSRKKVGSQSKINSLTEAKLPKATKNQQVITAPSLAPSISQSDLPSETSSTQEMPSLTPENIGAILTKLKEPRITVAHSQNLKKQFDCFKGHITKNESKLAIAEHVFSTLHEQINILICF